MPQELAVIKALKRSVQSLRERYNLLSERGQLKQIFREAGMSHETVLVFRNRLGHD